MNHRFQHLRSRNNRFAKSITFFNHHLLQYRYFFGRNFYAQITTSNHKTIRYIEDFINIINPFCIFNFGDNLNILLFRFQDATNSHYILSALHEGCGHKVHALLTAKTQIQFVLLGYRWQAKRYAWHGHPFAIADFATILNGGNDVITFNSIDGQSNEAIS